MTNSSPLHLLPMLYAGLLKRNGLFLSGELIQLSGSGLRRGLFAVMNKVGIESHSHSTLKVKQCGNRMGAPFGEDTEQKATPLTRGGKRSEIKPHLAQYSTVLRWEHI